MNMFVIKNCRKYNITFYLLMVVIFVGFVKSSVLLEDPLFYEIYQSYIKAIDIDEGTVSARRVFSNNKNYEIHIMKLEEVNGKKRHNLMVKESNATNPLIYISNPVETKIPHAYLTFEEFKKELTDRVLKLRQEFADNASKTRIFDSTKERRLDKEREKKKLKIFLNQLFNKRSYKLTNKTYVTTTQSILKEINNRTVTVTKAKKIGKSQSVSDTIATMTKSPIFRIFTLATDDNTSKDIKQSILFNETATTEFEQRANESNTTEITTTPEVETTLESPISTAVSEITTEPEGTIVPSEDNTETTDANELNSTNTDVSEISTEPEATTDPTENITEAIKETYAIESNSTDTTSATTDSTTIVTKTIPAKLPPLGKPMVFLRDEKTEDQYGF